MSKDRMREAAELQVESTARGLPEENREKRDADKRLRTERLVIRLSKDELRRISAYCGAIDLPVSTWARSSLLGEIRRA